MADQAIRIRMYRVGFGDCFLVTLPLLAVRPEQRHILIDCGVHSRGTLNILPQVVENIRDITDGRLSLLIATHAHQDHIAGFANCADAFGTFRIGEVWLPWTEDPADEETQALQAKQAALTSALEAHFNGLKAADYAVNQATLDAVVNLTGNGPALDALQSGFGTGAQVKYLSVKDRVRTLSDVPGLSITILGHRQRRTSRFSPGWTRPAVRPSCGGSPEQRTPTTRFGPSRSDSPSRPRRT